jgi:hypothetical protein
VVVLAVVISLSARPCSAARTLGRPLPVEL